MSSPKPRLRTRHVVLITLGAVTLCAVVAVLGYRWYTSPEQVVQRHLTEVEALPGVSEATARGDSPRQPQLHVALDDDVTAEQIAHLVAFAEDAMYHSMSATLDSATLRPTGGWPDADAIDNLLYAAALDLPAATPSTSVSSGSQIELHYPWGSDAPSAASEAATFLAELPDDAPPAVTSFEVRPDQLSHRRISLPRDLVHDDPELVQAVLATVEPLREDLMSLRLDPSETRIELGHEVRPSADDALAYRADVRDVMAGLLDHADLPDDYEAWTVVRYDDSSRTDYFQAYPEPAGS